MNYEPLRLWLLLILLLVVVIQIVVVLLLLLLLLLLSVLPSISCLRFLPVKSNVFLVLLTCVL